ncbi:MAG: hypothetical protein RL434_1499 [Pseudomonadota bacterium]
MTPSTLLIRGGLLCGLAAPLWWIFLIFFGATLVDGYSLKSDFISELAAHESPAEGFMVGGGFVLTGILYLWFAGAASWTLRHDVWAWIAGALFVAAAIARIAAGVYQCDPGCLPSPESSEQLAHRQWAAVGYLLMMLSAIAWGATGTRHKGLGHLLAWCIGACTWGLVCLVLMSVHEDWQGLLQRLAAVAFNVWVAVLALALVRRPVQ